MALYYIIYANEGDEKLRRFRAVPTVEMLRATWEKTTNPYIRAFTLLQMPSLHTRRKILLPRPKSSHYQRPITAYLFYALPAHQLSESTELVLDFPGGGFICMTPEHHEERLRMWAATTRRPVLSIDYGKAPEYPYPFAVDEAFDVYKLLVESKGAVIGMSGKKLDMVISGDSAGATMAMNVVIKTLEFNAANPTKAKELPLPVALLLNYAALDFNFGSWMTQENLRILRTEQSSGNLPGLSEQKDHLKHISPLSMVDDSATGTQKARRHKRKGSWRDTIRGFTGSFDTDRDGQVSTKETSKDSGPRPRMRRSTSALRLKSPEGDWFGDDIYGRLQREEDKPLQDRIIFNHPAIVEEHQEELSAAVIEADNQVKSKSGRRRERIGTRLTLTSRTGYFQDRIMRAMALLYVGRVREAKRSRKTELDLALSGKSARFGEDLRMSVREPTSPEHAKLLREERDQLAHEEDWVQLTLFAGWSHGYLQMGALMREAKAVIEDQADCIDDAFQRWGKGKVSPVASASGNIKGTASPYTQESDTDDYGITFVTKKYQGGNGSILGTHEKQPSFVSSPVPEDQVQVVQEEDSKAKAPTRPQAGHKISEVELMQRRRMLDAHMFE
ncbi:hypothetical protein VNI00_004085 [Paramarasmius palmivorus]|uniref:Alpha/beta hydrolase fold-3 domain-containing protein n=1 Tax=Paramarasmius palmivorus TaxID=297713 RepID=A0AAW0DLK5_9AGAR